MASFETTILEGETDRLTLRVPEGVEIVDVSGGDVLQWRNDGGAIDVRLRYLVSERAAVQVLFQFPVDLAEAVALRMPLPASGTPFTGAIGVQGPAGFEAAVDTAVGATPPAGPPPRVGRAHGEPAVARVRSRRRAGGAPARVAAGRAHGGLHGGG